MQPLRHQVIHYNGDPALMQLVTNLQQLLQRISDRVSALEPAYAVTTGYTAMTGTPDKATAYGTGTVTLAQLAGRVAQLQADLTSHGIIGA